MAFYGQKGIFKLICHYTILTVEYQVSYELYSKVGELGIQPTLVLLFDLSVRLHDHRTITFLLCPVKNTPGFGSCFKSPLSQESLHFTFATLAHSSI